MLGAYVKKEGVSLLGDTGVEEKDILAILPIFSCWMEKHPDANILDFFHSKRIKSNVTKALAVIGLRMVVAELNQLALLQAKLDEGKEEGKTE